MKKKKREKKEKVLSQPEVFFIFFHNIEIVFHSLVKKAAKVLPKIMTDVFLSGVIFGYGDHKKINVVIRTIDRIDPYHHNACRQAHITPRLDHS